MTAAAGVGVVGCGAISARYLDACRRFALLDLVGCADAIGSRAIAVAAANGAHAYSSTAELLEDPAVEVVVNLTPPAAHAEVTRAALAAGKHVYSEKPLAPSAAEGAVLVELARSSGLRLGCAPDTFLGAGLQTCREIVASGRIGEPVAATATFLDPGPDDWHPNPQFFYDPGAGPLFDMGPYYVTALVSLLGPVRSVTGMARASSARRRVGKGPRAGTTIEVGTPTHVSGVLQMCSGPLVSLTSSFDVVATEHPPMEVYGTEGALSVPDPNEFGGPVRVRAKGGEWEEVPLRRPYAAESRGVGLADMVAAARSGRPHRAGAELALHVVETLALLLRAAELGTTQELTSTARSPDLLTSPFAEREMT